MFGVKVLRMTKGDFKGGALAFFDVALGEQTDEGFIGVFTVKGFVLKAKNDGGFFYQAPAKKRMKNGEPVKDDKGYDVWDPYFDLFFTEAGDAWKPSKAAWRGKDMILEQAEAAYAAEGGKQAGRGAAPKAAPAKVKATAKVGAAKGKAKEALPPEPENEELDEEDDDLPF